MRNTLLFHSSKSLLLTFISLALLSTLPSHPTSALTYQNETDVEFTINPTISVSLSSSDIKIEDLAPGSSKDSNIVTVSVSTNAGYGYYLSATAGTKTTNTDLTNTADSTYKFTNLSSNVASLTNIPDNNWGYSYSTDNGTTWVSGNAESTSTGYNGLPLDNNDEGATGITLINTDSAVASSSVKFKIGAKASGTQPSGTYNNVVNFYAVTNPEPTYLQNLDPSLCTSTVSEATDSRDGTVYHIQRLPDGNCWLLDNLALDISDTAVQANLTENTTNASNSTLSYLKNGGGTTTDRFAIVAVTGNSTNSYSYSAPIINMSSKDVVPSNSNIGSGNHKVGGYYNYCAASAGGYCYGNGSSAGSSSGNATEDICPVGWSLPSGGADGEYQALANYITGTTSTTLSGDDVIVYRTMLSLPLAGSYIRNSVSNRGSDGNFWSSTRLNDDGMYFMTTTTDSLSPSEGSLGYGSFNGHSVRCILK